MSGPTIAFIVIGLRFALPLLIPRFPLPAIIACLVLDGVDQSVFQALTDDPLTWYQSYDKALDVFSLSVAYIACMRNWRSTAAFRVAEALFFCRLLGTALFETFEERWLLFVFPNTFEYYFIVVEVIRTRWSSLQLSGRFFLTLAAAIWILIKLPQEWWIHIAQLDFTEFMAAHPDMWIVVAALVVAAALALAWSRRRWPPVDHPFRITLPRGHLRQPADQEPFFSLSLLKKVLLLAGVAVAFGPNLPNLTASSLRLGLSVAVFVVVNAAVTQFLVRRGRTWATAGRQFVGVTLINTGLLLADEFLPFVPLTTRLTIPNAAQILMVPLLSLLIALFDRYHPDSPGSPRWRRLMERLPGMERGTHTTQTHVRAP